jgi:hypothetical protein
MKAKESNFQTITIRENLSPTDLHYDKSVNNSDKGKIISDKVTDM